MQRSGIDTIKYHNCHWKIVSKYDQEIPQSQTAANPVASLNHHETPGRQIKQSNQLSLPNQDDCNTRMDILMGKRELVALLNLSSWCLVMVERLSLAVPRCCLQFVIVVFPDHTHLLFLTNGQ